MTAPPPEKLLDDIGWKLLTALQADARLPFSELGRQVGLSAPAVAERVRRLEDAGVIRGYRADVDPSRLGLPLQAVIRLTVPSERAEAASRRMVAMPEVLGADRLTGQDCFMIRVAVASVAHLQDVIDLLARYGAPVTSLVLSSPVPARGVAPPTLEE